MQNIIGIVISNVYVFACIGLASLVAKRQNGRTELSRKLIHILCGNWVFLTPLFPDLWGLLFVPFCFIFVNLLNLKYSLFPAMERDEKNYGTVWYAASMCLLSAAGFLLRCRTIPYIGLLILAYGDGFAALFGQKWGKTPLFSFAPNKTKVGSLTVGVAAFGITAASLVCFRKTGEIPDLSLAMIFFIASLTALFSVFVEAAGTDGTDNLTLPIGAGLFATFCVYYGDTGYYLYLATAVLILALAYRLRAITVDAVVAALLTAMTLYALGGLFIGLALFAFFLLGSGVSKIRNAEKKEAERYQEGEGGRNWKQVLCNSLPASVLVGIHAGTNDPRFLLLAFAAFSAAAADTFASELGMLSKGQVVHILTGKPVRKGLSGGVSVAGLGAALLGSTLLSLFVLSGFGWKEMLFATVSGFVSCLVDSILGAAFQRKYRNDDGELQDRANAPEEIPAKGFRFITNNTVNLMSLTFTAILGILFLSMM